LAGFEMQQGRIGEQTGQDGGGWCRDESGLLLPWTRSLGPRSVRVPTVAGLSRMGMKIYTVGARRMPRYFRVAYHQKWARTEVPWQQYPKPLPPATLKPSTSPSTVFLAC